MSYTTINPQTHQNDLGIRLSKLLALFAVVIVAFLLLAYGWLGLRWWRQAYLGLLLTPDLVVTKSHTLVAEPSPAMALGLQAGDRIVAVAGEVLPADSSTAYGTLMQTLAEQEAGERVRVSFERSQDSEPVDGEAIQCIKLGDVLRCAAVFELVNYPLLDFLIQFGLSWIVGIIAVVLSVIVLRRHWNQILGHQIAIFSALFGTVAGGVFDMYTTRVLAPTVYPNALILISGMLLIFVLSFPTAWHGLRTRSWIWLGPPLVILVLLLYTNWRIYNGTARLWEEPLQIAGWALFFAVLALGAGLVRRIRLAVSPVIRDQCAVVLGIMMLALLPIVAWYLSGRLGLQFAGQDLTFHLSLVTPFMLMLPGGLFYAHEQRGLLRGDELISRSIVYSLMTILLVLGYGLIVAGSTLFTGSVVQPNNPFVLAITLFLMALLFVPVRNALDRRVNLAYFRKHRLYQNMVEQFAQDITDVTTLNGIVETIRRYLEETLNPTHTFVFFPDMEAGAYIAHGIPTPETDVQFSLRSPLVEMLFRQRQALFLDPGQPLPPVLSKERSRLAVLGAPLYLPMRGQERLSGILVVGPRQSTERYNYEDLMFMQALTEQAALAVERAQVIANLESRVREMNVLGQVAQAVNFTVEFDDLLELIYAQTNRVLEAPNFFIVMRDPNTEELYYAFYSEADERIHDREGIRWRMGRDLLSEIVRGGQPVRVENYAAEVARRGVQTWLDNPKLRAWMGVPLSAPGIALGAMCVGSTDLHVTYSDEQLKVLWQIADQAAIALDKARLFREAQIRARQLTALNQISTQLATVFQEPERLLELITESAVAILESEAGSLLMIDPETQELEFKVAIGSEASDLVGKRLPPGTGLVGTVADRGEPVIVNDTTRDPRWFSGVDSATEFRTNTLLAAPLMSTTGVMGVLEVINKRDGGVFVEEDKRLLTTFAGQAAIAIENARLFQQTDLQLAARVEELDTMQRIDRELNETLKLQRVLDITLDWAVRESGATVGAVGMVREEPEGLQIMVYYGYPEGTFSEDELWPLERGVVGRVVRSGQPELVSDVSIDADYVETMPGIKSQLTVPLFTGGEVSGVILLESDEENAFGLLDLDFVSRLAEHASPAMANARLFAQLERATEARSEFVGFVAHELKTPMTSIQGFADLLLGGVVGPLNDQQKGFLATIRANVNRMNTLVSDLNDVTKLQTDRMYMEMKPIEFADVVQETLRPLMNQIADKDQTVNVRVPDRLPLIYADQNRLIQVMTNLVTNAYKYTPAGGTMTIFAEPARNLWGGGAAQVLHISVQDNGIGISEEDQQELFKPYFRTNNPEAKEQPGTGLGLVIVRGIVEQHGGRIWVESKLGEGSTFHVTIPLASAVPEAMKAAEQEN